MKPILFILAVLSMFFISSCKCDLESDESDNAQDMTDNKRTLSEDSIMIRK